MNTVDPSAGVAAVAVVVANTNAASAVAALQTSLKPGAPEISLGPCPPASESYEAIKTMKHDPPRVRYMWDAKQLIAAIWPDAPPTATLDDIAAKARAHREIFKKYGAFIATAAIPPL